jgi:hypothetical protein
VEAALAAGQALDHQPGLGVDEDGHLCSSREDYLLLLTGKLGAAA